ncbi:hypothetical protein IAT40_007947 [Kwoniella sp. CBS 6097]
MTSNQLPQRTGLPEIGSSSFTPRLLSYVLSHPSSNGWQISPSLFSALLLALVVKRGGVVIDVEQRGVERTSRVASEMTKTIFGLNTQHLSLSRDTMVDEILPKLSHTSFSSTSSSTPSSRQHVAAYHLQLDPNQSLNAGRTNSDRPSASSGAERRGCEVLIVTGLENTESPVQIKLCDVLTKKRIEVNDEVRRFEPLVIWVRGDQGKVVPSWVIDHFMCGLALDYEDLDPPPFDSDSDSHDEPIIPSDCITTLSALLPYVHIHPPLSVHTSNLLSAISTHPGLRTTFTQRAVRGFPELVKAHRLLSGSFDLPNPRILSVILQNGLKGTTDTIVGNGASGSGGGKKGLGGGIGGVDSWAAQAGEEPSLARLSRDAIAQAQANGAVAEAIDNAEVEDPFCTPSNVQGVWKVLVTHRVRIRKEKDEVMWLVKGSAAAAAAMQSETDQRHQARERRNQVLEVDEIVDEILRTV